MQSDSLLVPEAIVRPRSFAGLMTLYESNYLQLTRLIPPLETLSGAHCSRVAGDLPLYLEVLDRSRYTCSMRLSYLFAKEDAERGHAAPASLSEAQASGRWLADPDLRLRVYFDGRLAEVMSLVSNHRHAVLRDIAESHRAELDARWHRNTMLNKWLEYCIETGHLFL
jgi:uncharacterized protein YqiB (DUF1249 family)